MLKVEPKLPLMETGDRMTRDEFLAAWDAMPKVKFAELIGGTVYVTSPLTRAHGTNDSRLNAWLAVYAAFTPGCEAGANATWLMMQDAPQPDADLRILPDSGGQSYDEGEYVAGSPEFLGEVCLSSRGRDLHEKLELYEEAGVHEYLAVLLREQELRWHQRVRGRFKVRPRPADGIYRSKVFPGLWLDAAAFLANNMARVLAVLQKGIDSPEHADFVARLAKQKRR